MADFNFAQIGARYRYQYAALLHKAGMLDKLYTDFWMPFKIESPKLPSFIQKVAGRRNELIDNRKVVAFYELGHYLHKELNRSKDIYYQSGILAKYGSKFALRQLKSIDRSSGYIGMCSESLEVMQALKKTGSPTILVQYDACDDSDILIPENKKWKDWSPEGSQRSPDYYRRVYQEWEETGRIMVNSEWTRDQIIKQGADLSRIVVIPVIHHNRVEVAEKKINLHQPLRVLYVGSVVLRKGVQYLVEAARFLKQDQFEFFILGQNYQPAEAFKGTGSNFRFIGQVPYQEVSTWYQHCDVLVFPSLSDGFGSVQVEAMSYGLPVIASSSCAGVAEHEKSGFIIPPCDSGALGFYLQKLADDRTLLKTMSQNALSRTKDYSVETVGHLFHTMLTTPKNTGN